MTNDKQDKLATATLMTPPGRGGIAVIALCGPGVDRIIAQIFKPLTQTGKLHLGLIKDGDQIIDQAIVAQTQTGVEINIHGGTHIARRVMQLLQSYGVTPESKKTSALPCYHTKFNNAAIGAELLDAIALAKSRLIAKALSFQWSDGLSSIANAGDVESLQKAAAEFKTFKRLLNPPQIVLAGPPNAGKSTLTNLLTQRNVSIVHQTAGTTRDWVCEPALISGIPVWITDTAGIWEVTGDIDIQAVQRARKRANLADLVILLNPEKMLPHPDWLEHGNILHVITKCDMIISDGSGDVSISAHTGQGIDDLKNAILDHFELKDFDPEIPRAFTQRQVDIINRMAPGSKDAPRLIEMLLAEEL